MLRNAVARRAMMILLRYSIKRAQEPTGTVQLPVTPPLRHTQTRRSPRSCRSWSSFGQLRVAECALGMGRFWITRKLRSSSSTPHCCVTVAGSCTMASQFRLGDPDVDGFEENAADQRVAPHNLRRSARTDPDLENSVPLFLSDPDGEPDSSEYVTPLMKKPK